MMSGFWAIRFVELVVFCGLSLRGESGKHYGTIIWFGIVTGVTAGLAAAKKTNSEVLMRAR
jgi:hypothetical protein